MNSDVSILVVSCDSYQDLWIPFFSLFFKYWPDCPWKVYLGTNHLTFPDDRVVSIPVGEDRDYSTNLLAMLATIDSPRVLVWLEDLPPVQPISTARLIALANFADDRGIGYLKLVDIIPHADLEAAMGVGPLPRRRRYRVSMTVAFWDASVLRQLLFRGESAWALEKQGSPRSAALAADFYAVAYRRREDPPIRHAHLIVKGAVIRGSRKLLRRENLYHHLSARSLQTRRSALYVYLWQKTYRTGCALRRRLQRLGWRRTDKVGS